MRILRLRIYGFRGIREATIHFSPGQTVLVGPNSCGKSTIIEALALLFGRDRLVRPLTEHDFFGSAPQAPDRIRILATIGDFPDNAVERNTQWFSEGRAVPKWWVPSTQCVIPERSGDDDVLCAEVGFAARFDAETLACETSRYFHDDDTLADPFDEEAVTPLAARLVSEIGFFLVPAYRTWDRTISFGSELFRRVVTGLGSSPPRPCLPSGTGSVSPAQGWRLLARLANSWHASTPS